MIAGAPPSSRSARSSAGRSIRPTASRENVRALARPIPSIASALSALGWMNPLESTGTGGRPSIPSAPTSRPWRSPHHWRAAASPVKFAAVAPVVRAPPHSAGSSKSSLSQPSATVSRRVPSGEPTQLNAFWSSAVASQSAPSAAGVTPPVTKWKKRGPGEAVAASSPAASSSRASTAPDPSSGSGPPKPRATSSPSSGSTGRSSSAASHADAWSNASRAAAAVSSDGVTRS